MPSREKSHDGKFITFRLCAWHTEESARARVMKAMLLLIIYIISIVCSIFYFQFRFYHSRKKSRKRTCPIT
ncbi:Uncharacterised protein [Segatella copri]|nr:Uncharacterised protein [Segatella copri]